MLVKETTDKRNFDLGKSQHLLWKNRLNFMQMMTENLKMKEKTSIIQNTVIKICFVRFYSL